MDASQIGGEVKFRLATADDIDQLVALEYSCFDYERFSRSRFEYLISKAHGEVHVAVLEGKVVGYMAFLVNSRTRIVRAYSLAVDASARGRHIGRSLMEIPVRYMAEHHMRLVSLEVKTDNQTAISLYRKLGFEVSGLLKGYYDDGSDAYRMHIFHK